MLLSVVVGLQPPQNEKLEHQNEIKNVFKLLKHWIPFCIVFTEQN